jgi:dipeptidyl aminopeptidase/acylaminoacyl peptidase
MLEMQTRAVLYLFQLECDNTVASSPRVGPGSKTWSVWSPDGKYIAYGAHVDGRAGILRKPSDGSGVEETLQTFGPEIHDAEVVDWSPDGRYLSYDLFDINQGHKANWILPLFGEKKPFQPAPVAGSQFDGNFSPDGHWLAYFSSQKFTLSPSRDREENTRFRTAADGWFAGTRRATFSS